MLMLRKSIATFFFSFIWMTLTLTVAVLDLDLDFALRYICKGFGKLFLNSLPLPLMLTQMYTQIIILICIININ